MCVHFTCESCLRSFVNRCEEVAFESNEKCNNATNSTDPLYCESCTVVEGAIQQLDTLVYQAPFLESEGLAGIEKVASWERDGLTKLLFKQKGKRSLHGKAESRAERHDAAQMLKNMGLDGMTDERTEHQGFSMALTPEKKGQEDKENNIFHKRRESDLKGW